LHGRSSDFTKQLHKVIETLEKLMSTSSVAVSDELLTATTSVAELSMRLNRIDKDRVALQTNFNLEAAKTFASDAAQLVIEMEDELQLATLQLQCCRAQFVFDADADQL
jgi:hypothetical protein